MTETIVGFLADLGGTEFELWAANPVVAIEDDVFVVASPDAASERHHLRASWSDAGIHEVPDAVVTKYEAVPSDRMIHAQRVLLAGKELVGALSSSPVPLALTRQIIESWTRSDSGHWIQIGDESDLNFQRHHAQEQLKPLLIGKQFDTTAGSAREAAAALFKALAPEEDPTYLATLGLYYRKIGKPSMVRLHARRSRAHGWTTDDNDFNNEMNNLDLKWSRGAPDFVVLPTWRRDHREWGSFGPGANALSDEEQPRGWESKAKHQEALR